MFLCTPNGTIILNLQFYQSKHVHISCAFNINVGILNYVEKKHTKIEHVSKIEMNKHKSHPKHSFSHGKIDTAQK